MVDENSERLLGFQGTSEEFNLLGAKRFNNICEGNGLDAEGAKKVDEIYRGWVWQDGWEGRFNLLAEKLRGYPKTGSVLDSIVQISQAYATLKALPVAK